MNQLVSLRVDNARSVHYRNAPVSSGLPIPPEAELRDPDRLVLLDASGRQVPVQFMPLSRQADSAAIKWLLVQFLADVPAHSERLYTLHIADGGHKSDAGLSMIAEATGNGITINTGKLRLSVGSDGRLFPETMQLDVDGAWSEVKANAALNITIGGQTYAADAPYELKIEDNGDVRAVIKASGSYVSTCDGSDSGYAYVLYIEAWRGKSDLKLVHTIVNRNNGSQLADLGIEWPVAGRADYTIGDSDGFVMRLEPEDDQIQGVLSESFDECVVGMLGSSVRRQATGQRFWWMSVNTPDSMIGITVKDFHERYPKSLEGGRGLLRIGLLPGLSEVKDSFAPGGQMLDGYALKVGEARTHEMLLGFYPAGTDTEAVNQAALSFQAPLLALAPWEWYTGSKALGDLAPRSKRYPEYEKAVDESLAVYLGRRAAGRLYGDRNFGDDQYGRSGTWNNGEYDYAHVGMLHFLRGAGRDWYDKFARPYAIHFRDIDVCHAGKDAGKIYQHCEWHNSETPKLGSHAWLRGIMEYYCFSGDFRARDVAIQAADVWSSSILNGEGFEGTERGVTWPVISMLGMYQAIPEPRYLQAATVLIEKVLECHDPEEGHFKGTMDRPTTKDNWGTFVIGSPVLESLIMYAELTGDRRARETVVRAAKRLARLNWLDELGQWEYTHSMLKGDRRAHNPKTNKMVVPAVLYAYLYSGDEDLLHKSVLAFRNSQSVPAKDGKDLGQSYCFGIRIPALLDRCAESLSSRPISK